MDVDIPEDYTTCEYEGVLKRTDKAILIDFGDKKEWLPLSQVILWKEKDVKKISMPDWMYKQKGL